MPYIGNQPYQGVIDSGNILNGSIDTVDLKDGSVTSAKLETIGGLTAGSYTTANITVDSKGRVTLASNGSGGVSSITGTADQITASASTGAITLSLPQSINTTSSPSFANITLTGEIRGPSTLIIDPTTVGDDTGIVRIRGDLQVDGTTTTINSTTLEVADLNITLAKNAANAAAATGAGITVAGANATLTYASASDCWNFNKNIIVPADGTIFGYSSTGARSYIQLYSSAAADMSIGTTYNSASIKFLTGATQNGTVRMRISGDGDVSVNTTTARTKLFVASSNASDTITLGSVSGGFALSNLNTAYGTQFGSFSTGNGWIQVARMDGTPTAYNLCLQPSGGNVGIGGITNPVLTLHTVKDNSSAYDPSIVAFNTISAIANRTSGALTNALAGFFTEVNGEWYIGGVTNSANTNSDFVFVGRNGGTRAEKLRITSAGDVGIGTNNPSGVLDAGGNILSTQVYFRNNGTYASGSGGQTTLNLVFGGMNIAKIANTGTGQRDGTFQLLDENTIKVSISANASRGGDSYIHNGGNFGIGTPSPTAKLHVTGTSGGGYQTSNKIILQRTDATLPTGSIEFQGSGGHTNPYWNILTDADVGNDFGVSYNGSKFLQILSNGNVGIGTTSPDAGAKLTVAGGILTTSNFSATTAGTAGIDYISGNLRFFAIGTSGSTKGGYQWIAKGADNSQLTQMTLDASGNLLVGHTSSTSSLNQTAKLQVSGGIRTTTGFTSSISVGTITQNTTTTVSIPNSGLWILTNGSNNTALLMITIAGGSIGCQLIFSTNSTDMVAGTTTEPAGGNYLRVWMSSSTLNIKNINAYTGPYYLTPIATF